MKYYWPIILAFIPLFSFVSCQDDSNKNESNNILSSDRFVLVVLGNDTLLIQDGVAGFLNQVGTGGGTIDANGTYLVRQFTEYSNNTDTLRLYFIELFASEPSEPQKEAVVGVRSYGFGAGTGEVFSATDTAYNGVVVSLKQNGQWWTTEGYDQSASSFRIDSLTDNTGNASKYIIEGSFSGTLYDTAGNSITVTTASFKSLIIPE